MSRVVGVQTTACTRQGRARRFQQSNTLSRHYACIKFEYTRLALHVARARHHQVAVDLRQFQNSNQQAPLLIIIMMPPHTSSLSSGAALVVFARYPELGKVKTRLAAGITQQGALTFYMACAEHVFREVYRCGLFLDSGQEWRGRGMALAAARNAADIVASHFYAYCNTIDAVTPAQRLSSLLPAHLARSCQAVVSGVVYFTDPKDEQGIKQWLADNGTQFSIATQQQHPDLGIRMHAALAQQLQVPGCSKALVIGTDIPDMSADVIQRAVQALDEHDMVLGPAHDGGYYLLGLRKAQEELFEGISWSTDMVFEQQVANAQRLGYSLAPPDTLPVLRDVDTLDDLHAWLAVQLAAGGQHALRGIVQQLLQ